MEEARSEEKGLQPVTYKLDETDIAILKAIWLVSMLDRNESLHKIYSTLKARKTTISVTFFIDRVANLIDQWFLVSKPRRFTAAELQSFWDRPDFSDYCLWPTQNGRFALGKAFFDELDFLIQEKIRKDRSP